MPSVVISLLQTVGEIYKVQTVHDTWVMSPRLGLAIDREKRVKCWREPST